MNRDLDEELRFLLHDVARMMRVEVDRQARGHGMTRAQWALLLRLERNPGLSQKEIADMLEVEPISVARLVDRLEASGLVERRPDADDRRVWRLHLTAAAPPVLEEINLQLKATFSFVSEGITKEAEEIMAGCLLRMKSKLLQLSNASLAREVA